MAKKIMEPREFKKSSGKFVPKPEPIHEDLRNIEQIKKIMGTVSSQKHLDPAYDHLPKGTKESIKIKNKIQGMSQFTIEGNSDEYSFRSLNHKTAKELKDERIDKFDKARKAAGSKGASLKELEKMLKKGKEQQIEALNRIDLSPAVSKKKIEEIKKKQKTKK